MVIEFAEDIEEFYCTVCTRALPHGDYDTCPLCAADAEAKPKRKPTHWYMPTSVTDHEGGTFYVTACMTSVPPAQRTEDPEQVDCPECLRLYEHPNTPIIAAARLVCAIDAVEGKSDFHAVVQCNECDQQLNMYEYADDDTYVSVGKILALLGHCAFNHSTGAELMFGTMSTHLSAYEVNYAVGKEPLNSYEQRWRERTVA